MKSFFKYAPAVGIKSFFNGASKLTRVLSLLVFSTIISLGQYLVIAPKPALAAQPRVTMCHRTRSTTNPYRLITVSQGGINGHDGHASSPDRVWNNTLANGDSWGDIIPGDDAAGDPFWSTGRGQSSAAKNWSGSSTTGGKSFMVAGGTNLSNCVPMSARRFYEVMKLANISDSDIATDLTQQAANEDAAVKPAGGWTAGNVASAVGGVSVTTKSPSAVGANSATLEGSITTGGTLTTPNFQYGTSSTLATFTQTTNGSASNSATLNPSSAITGLAANTVYYYRVIGVIGADDTQGTYYGSILSFTTGKSLRTVAVGAASTSVPLGGTTTLSATLTPSGDAGATTYEVADGALFCSISGSTLTASATSTGTCTVRATDAGNGTYSAAVSPTLEINVTALTTRNLTIDAGSYRSSYAFDVGTKPKITATASAGNSEGAKSFSSSTTPVCTVNSSDGQVAFVDAGTCTLSASIAASGIYASANASSISFTITALDRTLTLTGNLATYAINATPPTMSASTTGGGTISYSSSTTPVCTVNSSSGVVTFVDEGTCSISSSITANSGYAAKSSSARSFQIEAISRTLSINAGSYSATYSGDATPPTITSTASEGSGTKTYSSSTTPVCTVNASSGVVTFVAAGTCTIGATIGVSGRHASATASPISFTISSTPTSSTTSSTSTTVASSTTTPVGSSTSTTVASTTTVRETRNVTTTVAANIVNNARRISICHATSSASNPYILISVDRNSLNGHGGHAGDIIPAPASGCPSASIAQISTTTTTAPVSKMTICHATAAGTYVQITVDRNGLNGHGDHLDDLIPAPSGGCPYSIRQYALQLVNTTTSVAPTTGQATNTTAVPVGKITICHATAAGFYVEITVDRSGLNGHGDHDGDVIPSPAGGCPMGVSRQSSPTSTTTLPDGKISICHATAAGIYVSLTVDRNGLNGHDRHEGDIVPAPTGGCPSRVSAQSSSSTLPRVPAGKVGICHATNRGTFEYKVVDADDLDGHDAHEQDIVPAPARGCPNPSSTVDLPETIACINAREIANLDESNSSLTDGVKVEATQSSTDDDSGTIEISNPSSGPALTLVGVESVDPNIEITVKSSGVDYNKPVTWVNEGYGTYCWKIEPFGDRDYIYTLPNPPAPPDARYAGLAYSTVIVKAGSLTTTDPNYQVNTLFDSPAAGSGVFADVNKNGVSDPGGQGGGTIGDKSISHVVLCVGSQNSIAKAPATTLPTSSTVGALQTTTTTINWSAGFCPEPTTTTSIVDSASSSTTTFTTTTTTTIAGGSTTSSSTTTTVAGGSTTSSTTTTTVAGGSTTSSTTTTTVAGGSTTSSSTTTTVAGGSTTSTTASPSTTLVTTTTLPGGPEDPNPPIEFFVKALKLPSSGVTDLVLTLSDGVKSEVVFLQLDVKNFSVVATSLPATGQERWSTEQQLGWLLFVTGALLGIIEIRRRGTLRR